MGNCEELSDPASVDIGITIGKLSGMSPSHVPVSVRARTCREEVQYFAMIYESTGIWLYYRQKKDLLDETLCSVYTTMEGVIRIVSSLTNHHCIAGIARPFLSHH